MEVRQDSPPSPHSDLYYAASEPLKIPVIEEHKARVAVHLSGFGGLTFELRLYSSFLRWRKLLPLGELRSVDFLRFLNPSLQAPNERFNCDRVKLGRVESA